jgi:nicotinate-nucleotide adenylyltransferase
MLGVSLVMNRQIGIFSGTFDPVHRGHIEFARKAFEAASLDEINVYVERTPNQKRPFASIEHRMEMTTIAFSGIHGVSVHMSSGSTTSFDDMRMYDNDELHLLVGSDNVAGMASWDGFNEWAPRIGVLIGMRSGEEVDGIDEILGSYDFKRHLIISTDFTKSASSIARKDHHALLPSIADYVSEHRLYD